MLPHCRFQSGFYSKASYGILTVIRLLLKMCVLLPAGNPEMSLKKFRLNPGALFCRILPEFPVWLIWRPCANRCGVWGEMSVKSIRRFLVIWLLIILCRWMSVLLPGLLIKIWRWSLAATRSVTSFLNGASRPSAISGWFPPL